MNSYCLRIILTLSMICILSYKINAHENITTNPETCPIDLLSHEEALSVFLEAIEQNDIDKLLIFKTMD